MSDPGLYIHIPFCRSKCPYCGFYSVASFSHIPRYLAALQKEMGFYKGQFGPFDSLYLGGGTPTLLEIKDLERILNCLYENFEFTMDVERTIEANPCDMSHEKISGLRLLGFNRINLGVQSFNDEELLFLGRSHNRRAAEDALEGLRLAGFDNIGLDLIYGLHGQAIKGWIGSLRRALSFEPEHLSCYQLSIEKGTVFYRMQERGVLERVTEEEERSFFIATSGFLEDRGYIHYEISNFAREKCRFSRHNCKYWRRTPYLGLGPAAHSFNGSKRWWNYRSIRRYCEALEHGKMPIEDDEELSDEQKRIEMISLGLRTRRGIDMKELGNDPGLSGKIKMLIGSGHIEVFNDRVMPTREGYLVADSLPLYFFMS